MVIVHYGLETTSHYNATVAKDFRTWWSLCWAYKFFDKLFRVRYPTYVRSHPQYCVQATSLCLIKTPSHLSVIGLWERISEGSFELFYDERSKLLNIFPWSYRRTPGELILEFRIFNNHFSVTISELCAPLSTSNLQNIISRVQKCNLISSECGFVFLIECFARIRVISPISERFH